jgi:hypothetical protein|tara:strand:- start:400 stop:642 length:243 start_codon:yes stop_codon:yes gene_type:complete
VCNAPPLGEIKQMKKVKVIIEVDGVVISEEDTKTFHEENLEDIFSDEYKECTEQEQFKWCLETLENSVEDEFKRIIKGVK